MNQSRTGLDVRVFNVKLAAKIGTNESILLQQIYYWTIRTKHVRNGKRWFYTRVSDWAEQFPNWSERTIIRILYQLESMGLIEIENHNVTKWLRTNWYTINFDSPIVREYFGSQSCLDKKINQHDKLSCSNQPSCHVRASHVVSIQPAKLSPPITKNTSIESKTKTSKQSREAKRQEILDWFNLQPAHFKEEVEKYAARTIQERKVERPAGYRISLIGAIKDGTADGWNYTSLDEIQLLCDQMYGPLPKG